MSSTGTARVSGAAKERIPRLLERYRGVIAPALAKEFKHRNLLSVARLEKIVLNIGCGTTAKIDDAKHILEKISNKKAITPM